MNQEQQTDQIEDFQGLIGSPKGWILRWGMSSILLILILFLVFAAIFRYPDRLEADIRVTAGGLPVKIVARESGRLSEIYVEDGQEVQAGTWLAVIENPADPTAIRQLKTAMESWSFNPALLGEIQLPESLKLGEIKPVYARFERHLTLVKSWLAADQTISRKSLLQEQLTELEQVQTKLKQQEKLLEEEIEVAATSFIRQKALYQKGAISLVELEAIERLQFQYKRDLANLQIRQSETSRTKQTIRQAQVEIEESQAKWLADQMPLLSQYKQELESALNAWEQTFVLVAPVAGSISFGRFRDERQRVTTGDLVFTILSRSDLSGWVSEAVISSQGAGRIQLGDQVEIELFDFPAAEFGKVEGQVSSLSLTPEAGTYSIQIALADTLLTTFGKPLPFRPILEGKAYVITDKRSLLKRMVGRFRN
ncbi:MAG: HlyD family efflux transporter periplasmic adaptor subunit [Saprospiraceae bacterium]|nr:HlyD family efflux transporter periplasmic adaptor subunit [Saprospiraceae bacterium]